MMSNVPVTIFFHNELQIGSAELTEEAVQGLKTGEFVLAPALLKYPDGRVEIKELSLVPYKALDDINLATSKATYKATLDRFLNTEQETLKIFNDCMALNNSLCGVACDRSWRLYKSSRAGKLVARRHGQRG